MLSYRHVFHAGNHADVLKHFCLFEILNYFNQKAKPYCYIDTHAGAGYYLLNDAMALKNKEYQQGIELLLTNQDKLNVELKQYIDFLTMVRLKDQYIGSPWLAQALMPNDNELFLYELHPTDYQLLKTKIKLLAKANIKVFHQDGLQGLLSIMPPKIRRAVILIDPSYELKQDYLNLISSLQKAYKKFSTACYMIWYPCLMRQESKLLPLNLAKISKKYLRVELHVSKPSAMGFGMFGSGLWIINPPYLLHQSLANTLPILQELLKQDDSADFILETAK